VYRIETGEVFAHDAGRARFVPLGDTRPAQPQARPADGAPSFQPA
jgi:hypothetical protein